jgi:hypothetical protein
MTPEQYLALARRSGATVYTNRHYPLQPAVAFSHSSWLKFCELLAKPAPGDLSVVTDDPCPGCRPGTACRTPTCGRLAKINLARANQIAETVDSALEKNGGKTGWPPTLLQDDSRKLSKWFASRPDALYVLRKNLK